MRKSISVVISIVFVCIACGARSEIVISPFWGQHMYGDYTEVHFNSLLDYAYAGHGVIGVDLGYVGLPYGMGLVGTYMRVGNSRDEFEGQINAVGDHWAIGLQRPFRVGSGGVSILACYLYRTDDYSYETDLYWAATYEIEQSGFLCGASAFAPFSNSLDLVVHAKIEVGEGVESTVYSPIDDEIVLSRSGSAYIVAIGLNWRLDW